jgi:hypothetical protein
MADFFDGDERLGWLSAAGNPLVRLAVAVDFEVFRGEPERKDSVSHRLSGSAIGEGSGQFQGRRSAICRDKSSASLAIGEARGSGLHLPVAWLVSH